MRMIHLAIRNLIARPLSLLLSLLLLILSISLVTFAIQISKQLGDQLNKNIQPFDMVVGAKGSPLQLVLSSVLHLDDPTGNIDYGQVKPLMSHPFVEYAIPVSYGDNYKGFRILGTQPAYLEQYEAQLDKGTLYTQPLEVVVGAGVASQLALSVGDRFNGTHGLVASEINEHNDTPYRVAGILSPTQTVVDQLIITSLESVWETHAEEEGQLSEQEITSLLVKFKSPMGLVQIPRSINQNSMMQAALPGMEVQRIQGLMGAGTQGVKGISLAILLVSGLSIFIGLLKNIRERKPELALLRVYGYSRWQLLQLVLSEGIILCLTGSILGWIVGRIGLLGFSAYSQSSYGIGLTITSVDPQEGYLFLAVFVLSVVASLAVAIPVFRLQVAQVLNEG